ncbi:hypothetical protein ACI65C_002317 [Semiaphis heraclei]
MDQDARTHFRGVTYRSNLNNDRSQNMDRQSSNSQANRTNQCNPNHQATGQGRPSAYQGSQDRANVNNHGNQLNPNNDRYV